MWPSYLDRSASESIESQIPLNLLAGRISPLLLDGRETLLSLGYTGKTSSVASNLKVMFAFIKNSCHPHTSRLRTRVRSYKAQPRCRDAVPLLWGNSLHLEGISGPGVWCWPGPGELMWEQIMRVLDQEIIDRQALTSDLGSEAMTRTPEFCSDIV